MIQRIVIVRLDLVPSLTAVSLQCTDGDYANQRFPLEEKLVHFTGVETPYRWHP